MKYIIVYYQQLRIQLQAEKPLSGLEVIKLFFMLNSAEYEIFSANKEAKKFISKEIFMLSYV